MNKKVDVHFYLNSECNLRCKHCYENLKSSNSNKKNLLDANRIQSICTDLVNNFDVDIHMEGGEIFLRDDISEIFAGMNEKIKNSITITTNGTCPWREEYSTILGINRLRFSIEGHKNQFQEELRGIKLEPVLDNMKVFKQKKFPVSIRATLFRQNYPYLPEMVREISRWGVGLIEFYEYRDVGRGKIYSNQYMFGLSNYIDLFELLCEDPIDFNDIEVRINFSRAIMNVPDLKNKVLNAGLSMNIPRFVRSVAIECNGDIYPCSWQYGKVIGNIEHEDLVETIESNDYLRNHDLYCDKCTAVQVLSKNLQRGVT